MTGFTNAEEAGILDWYFRAQAFTPPASLFISLLTAAGNDDGTFTEIAYTGYAREEILAAEWAAGETHNGKIAEVKVASETAEENKATVEYELVYEDGATERRSVEVVMEGGSWKLGFIQSI